MEDSATAKNVYKKYITQSLVSKDEFDGTYTEYIANYCAGNVVSVYSEFMYQSVREGYKRIDTVFSGIILNNEGYILTSSFVTRYRKPSDAKSSVDDFISAKKIQIQLNSIYQDENLYSATLIDCDLDLGLAILKFKDNFYYYTDQSKKTSVKGFQFSTVFYDGQNTIKIGDSCAFVGETIGNGIGISAGIISNNKMSVSELGDGQNNFGNIIYEDKEYSYMQTTAAVNPEGMGGAVFDRNGYIIGIMSSKVYSDQDSSAFHKVGLVMPSACVMNYIDTISRSKQRQITYTYAEVV